MNLDELKDVSKMSRDELIEVLRAPFKAQIFVEKEKKNEQECK